MFTGIITSVGSVSFVALQNGTLRVGIESDFDTAGVEIGESIAVNGVCITVVEKTDSIFYFEAVQETLDKTVFGGLSLGDAVNLERSLKVGDSLSGHFVLGHVDGLVKVLEVQEKGDSWRFLFKIPEDLQQFVALKGSVAIHGVSLTVSFVDDLQFGVDVIPHTFEHTVFKNVTVGDNLHIEVDMMARYILHAQKINNGKDL